MYYKGFYLVLALMLLWLGACTPTETNVLPEGGQVALQQEIRESNLTQFEGSYQISYVQRANMNLVLDRYEDYFCVRVTPPIPHSSSSVSFNHYGVTRDGNNWEAFTFENSAQHEWTRIECGDW
jgi:outer membrane biogenesis lipoprotein LolB